MIHPHIPSPSALAAAGTAAAHPPRAEYAATLSRHTGVVNVVRFSPSGDVLASAGDDGSVLFWVRSDQLRPAFGESQAAVDPQTQYEKESWRVRLMSRPTTQELYDMAWSRDGDSLVVGGTDFAARVINTADGTVTREISEHQHYVQGVAWDPLNQFIATQSSDRAVHLYQILRAQNEATSDVQLTSRHASVDLAAQGDAADREKRGAASGNDAGTTPSARASSVPSSPAARRSPSPAALPTIRAPPSPRERWLVAPKGAAPTTLKLYGDDRYSSFFRRLAFSPDGALLATPTGQYTPPNAEQRAGNTTSAVYLYARGNFARSHAPIAALPGHKTATLVVEFSPILYRQRHDGEQRAAPEMPLEPGQVREASLGIQASTSAFALPYRMVYAIATQESVWVYDTQQAAPLCCFSNLHYASFTDLSWSPDGQLLMMSSTDGYCSVAVFDYHELGRPYNYAHQPSLQRTSRPEAPIPPDAPRAKAEKAEPTEPAKAEKAEPTKPAPAAPPVPSTAPSTAPSDAAAPKKKRRVALTFEGPLS